jgi:phosphoserine phosphatase RsbU/P
LNDFEKPGANRLNDEPRLWQEILQLGVKLLSPEIHSGIGKTSERDVLAAQRSLIIDTAERVLDARAEVWFAEGMVLETSRILEDQAARVSFQAEEPSDLMRHALLERQVCCREELNSGEILPGVDCLRGDESLRVAAAAAPFLSDEENGLAVLGGLQVMRTIELPFTPFEIELLEGLALQSAIALHSDHQNAIERWRVEQLSLVRQVSAQIADVRDLDELSRRVTSLVLDTFDYYYVAIFTLKPGADVLHFRNSAGPKRRPQQQDDQETDEIVPPVFAIHVGQGLIGQVAQSGEEILANDVSRDQRYRYTDALPETQAEVALPLKVEDRIVGVLDVQSDQKDDFSETDMLVLRALAGNIAIAVEGAWLYSALRHRAEQLATISEVSNAITSILDLDKLLSEVVNLIQKSFGYPYVHIFTVHTGRRKVFYHAGSGSRSQAQLEQNLAYDLDDPLGIIPWVARQGETVLANDVDQEPRYRPSVLPPANTRAELSAPLIFGGEVLGVLDIQSDQRNAFGEDDRFLIEALADNIAIAMRNANLYRSERWRRQVAESLREVAGLLSAEADLDRVLHAILEELDRTLPCDVAAIWLLNEDRYEIELGENEIPGLHLAAIYGANISGLDLQIGLSLEDVLAIYGRDDAEIQSGLSSLMAKAIQAEQAAIRTSPDLFDPLGIALDFPEDYSAVAAPLRVGEQHLGVLTMAHHTPGRYGSEAQGMTTAFASYAAVAIENTRLYEAAHEQAWVSTVLLQVTDATQSLTNLNELLATVVRITPMLVGVKACALYMRDENDAFVPAAAYGLNHEAQTEFERWRFAPGDVPVLDRLVSEKQPLILHGDVSDPLLTSILFAGQQDESLYSAELLVLVPLLARGDILGAFLIDYSNDHMGSTIQSLEAMFDERLAIIQGIAHQTAIAVENIRLLKAQREEAYVSVALLQVAQAVVSSNDLNETLGSIVRITPILVGVKRSLIFLWEPEHSLFRLAQAYGVPRSSTELVYAPIEFPLLEAVRQWDALLAYPLGEEESGENEPFETWEQIIPPELDEVDEYLQDGERLLIAFPLSVKGEVLGVMIVEEPESVSANSFTGGVPRRLREKRLEITTGISQQAALAIQNDKFQREMLERERLEREFQLAREIQRTFLPHELPQLPGWDLDVRWHTAREVGGDFYDFFELSGGRLGLVIADVADKGMPAALFMTLIRTLVRATVQEIDSPAAVLERVNDVLLPDAQKGMFVTIVYAVISLETGQLFYANAGHNPPVLLHAATRQLEILKRCGMALGVQADNHIEERTVSIEPGDSLILYTDGLTEAFSLQGEMYGDERLYQVLQQTWSELQDVGDHYETERQLSAKQMLDLIESSLSAFVQEAPAADDLTLVALKRLISGERRA